MKQWERIVYSMGRLGSSALLDMLTIATFWIYLTRYQLNPILDGLANALGKLVIAFSSYLIGYISDNLVNPRLGRRKPFMILGAPLLTFSFIMIFSPHFFIVIGDQINLFIYLTFFNGLFQFSYGLLITPYQAWMPELTNEQERVVVSSYQNTFNLLGGGIGTVATFALPALIGTSPGFELLIVIITLGLIQLVFYIPAIIFLKNHKQGNYAKTDLVHETCIALKNRNYLNWLLCQGLLQISASIIFAVMLIFIEQVLLFSFLEYLVAALILLFVVIAFFSIWDKLAIRIKIRRTLMIALFVLIFILPFTLVIGSTNYPVPIPIQGILFITILAAGLAGYYIFPYAILAHIVEVDEIKTKGSRSGIYTGFGSITINLFQSIGLLLTGFVINHSLGLQIWGPVCAIFIILSMVVLTRVETDPDYKKLRKNYP